VNHKLSQIDRWPHKENTNAYTTVFLTDTALAFWLGIEATLHVNKSLSSGLV
jgi:hypothetical protein